MAIHPTAIVHPQAVLHETAEVGPFCVIDANVRIAAGCRLYQNVFVTGWTQIDEGCELHPGVIVGHAPQDTKYDGARTYCRIGKRNILREYVTIHRGTTPESETVIGDDCFLLAGCHAGHNVRLGNGVTIINDAILGGHVEVENGVTIGGGSAVHQFVRLGELAMIAGQARVASDIPPYALADAQGRIAGLNRIGLRRAGVVTQEAAAIRDAYRVLYGSRLPFRDAVARLAREADTERTRRLAAFLQRPTRRGIAGRSRGRRQATSDAGD